MKKCHALGKRALLALFLATMTSCCCFSWLWCPLPFWCCPENCVQDACFNSQKIYLFPACGQLAGLELELENFRGEIRMFININGPESVTPYCSDPDKVEIQLHFRDHHYRTLADSVRGGRRILLPDAVRDEIVTYLFDMQPIRITVGA